jgi:hypothetical protein
MLHGFVELKISDHVYPLLQQLGGRTVLKKDLFYLARINSEEVSEFVISKLSNSLSLSDLAVLCDISPPEHTAMRNKLIQSLELKLNSCESIPEEHTEKLLYVISKLNYGMPRLSSLTVPRSMVAKKAAVCLLAVFRQEINVSVHTLTRFIDLILKDSTVSAPDLTTALLALVSIPEARSAITNSACSALIQNIIAQPSLNAIDMRQIHKILSANHLLKLQLPLDPLVALLDKHESNLSGTASTSKGHKEVLATLGKILKTQQVMSEAHAAPLIIDILVS